MDFKYVKNIVKKPKFNLWTYPTPDGHLLVPADEYLKSSKQKYAFPLQLPKCLYKTLFTLFAPRKVKKRDLIPKTAFTSMQMCQSIGVFDEDEWVLHWFESKLEYYQPGIEFAANKITEWNYDQGKEVRKKSQAPVFAIFIF